MSWPVSAVGGFTSPWTRRSVTGSPTVGGGTAEDIRGNSQGKPTERYWIIR